MHRAVQVRVVYWIKLVLIPISIKMRRFVYYTIVLTLTEYEFQLAFQVPYNTRLVADLRQLMTLRQHYYPEGGWGWIVVVVAFIVQCISNGLHLSLGIFIIQVVKEFHEDHFHAGQHNPSSLNNNYKLNLIFFLYSRNFSNTISISGVVLFPSYNFTLYHKIYTANIGYRRFGDCAWLSFYLVRFTISSNNFQFW